jgi:hypothetical protein
MLLHFLDLAPIQMHIHACNLVGICFEESGYKHKWHKLYFTQQQRTDNNGLVFKCCILRKIVMRYMKKILKVVYFLDFLPFRMSIHFILNRKDKIRTVQKKFRRFVTLTCVLPIVLSITRFFSAVTYQN